MKKIDTTKWLWMTLAIIIIFFCINISLSFRHDAIQNTPNEYRLDVVAPFLFDSQYIASANLSSGNASKLRDLTSSKVQIAHLGQKTLLHTENLDLLTCSSATVYLAPDTESLPILSLGDVRYFTGNANYEIPFGTVIEKYSTMYIWCNSKNMRIGHAVLQ